MAKASSRGVKIHLPDDFVIGDEFKEETPHSVVTVQSGIPGDKMAHINMT